MTGNLERFSGFAQQYDSVRPKPPTVLKTLLLEIVQSPRPKLVVDVGCGTGLSTRFWADTAERVIGIEPNDDMRAQAGAATSESNVEFRNASSSATGVPGASADLVTCSQALHWMEPSAAFEEAARMLRNGGAFAAFDYDWPPATGAWQADQAYMECMAGLEKLERKESSRNSVKRWEKDRHLERMRESGCFRFTREMVVHHTEPGDADRLVGLLLSQGGVQLLLRSGYTEEQLGITRFRALCRETLGSTARTWYWSSRVRLGVK